MCYIIFNMKLGIYTITKNETPEKCNCKFHVQGRVKFGLHQGYANRLFISRCAGNGWQPSTISLKINGKRVFEFWNCDNPEELTPVKEY